MAFIGDEEINVHNLLRWEQEEILEADAIRSRGPALIGADSSAAMTDEFRHFQSDIGRGSNGSIIAAKNFHTKPKTRDDISFLKDMLVGIPKSFVPGSPADLRHIINASYDYANRDFFDGEIEVHDETAIFTKEDLGNLDDISGSHNITKYEGEWEKLTGFLRKEVPEGSFELLNAFYAPNNIGGIDQLETFVDEYSNKFDEIRDDLKAFNEAGKALNLDSLAADNEENYQRLLDFEFINDIEERDVIAVKDEQDETYVHLGDRQNNFSFKYSDSKGLDKLFEIIEDDIQEELNFFDFDGGEIPGDIAEEIQDVRTKSERIGEEYEDVLALFENLGLDRFEAKEDIENRLAGFDKEIEEAAIDNWGVSERAAEGLGSADRTSYIVDITPWNLDDRGRDHYLKVLTNSHRSNQEIDIGPEDVKEIQGDIGAIFSASLDPVYKAQMAYKIIEDVPEEADEQRRQIAGFTEVLEGLDDQLGELYEIFKTETDLQVERADINEHGEEVQYSDGDPKFGNLLVEVGKEREYISFINNETERIEKLLESEGDLPQTDLESESSPYREVFSEESPYFEMVKEAISEYEEEIRFLRSLAEAAGEEYTPDFGLSSKEGTRQHDPNFRPEEDEDFESLWNYVTKEAERDIENKLRQYTKEAIKNLGREAVLDEYEEATGERPDELDRNEIAALKVRKRQGRKRGVEETVDKLLEHQNKVYELESNQEWLKQHRFTQKELIDPDLSTQTDGEYTRPDDPEYNSGLQVEVDPSDIEMDTEREKQQYWDEATELLEGVGIESEFEDIEKVEQAVQELEEPEDEEDYRELKDAISNYHSVENRAGGIPDELTLRVADPMDTTRMGQGFGSCHNIDGGSYAWASISNAVDANKMVFYAEDKQDRERARVKAFITEDEELVYHNTSQYKDIDIDTSDYFQEYMEKVTDELGLELKHSREADGWKQRTELLEAHDWYSRS